MIVKLLTEHHLEFLSLKGGCRWLSESTLVKMSNCWKSHDACRGPFVMKIFVLSIFEWPFYTGFTVIRILIFSHYSVIITVLI